MKKQILCALLAALCVLPSCGGSVGENDSESRGTAVEQEQEEAKASAAQKITEALSGAAVGDTVLFGSYEQDGDLENGAEEIEWIVLDEQDGGLLLLSDRVLDEVPYTDDSSGDTWADSYLRSWLNSTFLDTAFTETEQSFLCTVTVCTLREEIWNSANGADSQDQVFLLSATEMQDYLPDYKDRRTGKTTYANKSGHTGTPWVWLRCNAIGSDIRYMDNGQTAGNGDVYSCNGDSDYVGVRPAVWVSVDGNPSQNLVLGENEQARMTQVGDILSYGDLDWLVLAIEEDQLFLITEDCLQTEMAYNSQANDLSWEASTVRSWLNSEFLSTYFDQEEQAKILITTVATENSPDTQDQVYLLSSEEAQLYFYTSADRMGQNSSGRSQRWMLRSTVGDGFSSNQVEYVNTDGQINDISVQTVYASPRPVIWIQDASMLLHPVEGNVDTESLLASLLGEEAAGGESGQQENAGSQMETEAHSLMGDAVYESDRYLINGTVLGSQYFRRDIQRITFLDSLSSAPNTAWDVSAERDRSILAWVEYDVETELYNLYIGSNGVIVADECRDLFGGYCMATAIEFNGCFQIGEDTDFYRMFSMCTALESLDVSFFDTSGVQNVQHMFYDCVSLNDLDVSSWDTSQMSICGGMFYNCNSLTELDLSGWDLSAATDLSQMFYHCSSLTSLGVETLAVPANADTTEMYAGTPWDS